MTKPPTKPRTSSGDRLQRLLAIIPWVAAHDGPTLGEVASHFDVGENQLLEDIQTASFVGAWPRTPDELVEVTVEDDRVWVHYARSFSRPLRLNPEQGLALLAAASGALAVPGADLTGPLASGLRKLADTLGIDPDQAIDVEVGAASAAVLDELRAAVSDRRQVEIDYYSYGRDERTTSVIDPYRVYAEHGQWYVLAWCHRAGGERLFRVDRIHRATTLETGFEPRVPQTAGAYRAEPDDPRIVLELEPSARWVLEQYPIESVKHLAQGRFRVTLAVSALPWLERLLLRLGPEAKVVARQGRASGLLPDDPAGDAARRVLARYRKRRRAFGPEDVLKYPDEFVSVSDPAVAPEDEPEEIDEEEATAEDTKPSSPSRTLIEWAIVIVGAVVVALVIKTFLFQAFYIPTGSMEPTLDIGDRVLVNKLSYKTHDVNRGDIVVFHRPANSPSGGVDDLIKRVVALPGETIEVRNGKVFVDGEQLEEPYLPPGTTTPADFDAVTVPEGHVFVLGDNRGRSEASNAFGPIDVDLIVGRAFIKVWPLNDLGGL